MKKNDPMESKLLWYQNCSFSPKIGLWCNVLPLQLGETILIWEKPQELESKK